MLSCLVSCKGIFARIFCRQPLIHSFVNFKRFNEGYFINILNDQVTRALDAFASTIQFFVMGIGVLVYTTIGVIASFYFGLSVLLFGVFIVLIFRLLSNKITNISRTIGFESEKLSSHFLQLLSGFKYFTGTYRRAVFKAKVQSHIKKVASEKVKAGVLQALATCIQEPMIVVFAFSLIGIHSTFFQHQSRRCSFH